MNPNYRHAPHQALPKYRYIPGKGPKDEKRQDIPKFNLKKLNEENWKSNEAYLYGIDLFNHAFYYEAHEVWEELWHFTGRNTHEGKFLKAMIQCSAALLKSEMEELKPATRLMKSADKILASLKKKREWMGLPIASIYALIRKRGIDNF